MRPGSPAVRPGRAARPTWPSLLASASPLWSSQVKPVSTIGQAQQTSTFDGKPICLEAKGRHDPCVLPRTPPLVEGMAALVLIDAALLQRTRLGGSATTVCDGSAPFEPNGAAEGGGKKARHA